VIISVLSYSKKHKDIMWCWARSVSDCCFFCWNRLLVIKKCISNMADVQKLTSC